MGQLSSKQTNGERIRKRGINLGLGAFLLRPQLHPWDGVKVWVGDKNYRKEVPMVLRGFLYHIPRVLLCLL